MKNVLVIFASPRENGNTRKLTDKYLSNLSDVQIYEYNVYKENPAPCDACGYCSTAEGCSKNDLNEFIEKFISADMIIFATPIYNFSFPAPMKALIDRFQRFYSARFDLGIKPPVKKHREATLIVTNGSPTEDGFEFVKKQLETIFTVTNIELVDCVHVKNTDVEPINK